MDHQLKLARAKEHIDALEEAINAFFKPYPYALTPKLNPNTGKYLLYINDIKSIPVEWSVVIGDALHNMRSSLDALTYAISAKVLPNATNNQVNRLQFPICDNFGLFAGEWCKRLPHLDNTIRAAFESLQPYSGSPRPLGNPLERLRDLHNIDKHRHLVLAFVNLHSGNVGINHPDIPGGLTVSMRSGILKNGAVVAEYALPPSVDYANVDMTAGMGLDITFDHGRPAQGEAVKTFLFRTYLHIRDLVFPPLEKFL
jgi:hypothetical protein